MKLCTNCKKPSEYFVDTQCHKCNRAAKNARPYYYKNNKKIPARLDYYGHTIPLK